MSTLFGKEGSEISRGCLYKTKGILDYDKKMKFC